MKNLLLLSLFISVSVTANPLDEEETALLERAKRFSGHPLYEYMIPQGSGALWHILRAVSKDCRQLKNMKTDLCSAQRVDAQKRMFDCGFEKVSPKDFTDPELFALAADFDVFYRKKYTVFLKEERNAPVRERAPYTKRYYDYMNKQSELLKHLQNSRLPEKPGLFDYLK